MDDFLNPQGVPDAVYQDDMEGQLDVYERGRLLRTIPVEAWQIIKDTIHSYTEDLDQQIRRLPPGDPTIVASHAALYAMNSFEEFFLQDTEAAMEFSSKPSPELKHYLIQARDALDVLKQQGT